MCVTESKKENLQECHVPGRGRVDKRPSLMPPVLFPLELRARYNRAQRDMGACRRSWLEDSLSNTGDAETTGLEIV